MPRHARLLIPGAPLHIIHRGHYRQPCFLTRRDALFYLDQLREHRTAANASIHAYVLMSNHVHLLVSFEDIGKVGEIIGRVAQRYASYLNARLGRRGTLWDGRFRSSPETCERYLLTCQRYIELNPVRAGLRRSPDGYPWSSYSANAGKVADHLVTPHEVYLRMGNDAAQRAESYRALFDEVMPQKEVDAIRTAANRNAVLKLD